MKSVHFSGVDIKAGQTWKRRDGGLVKIEENPDASHWVWRGVKDDGTYSTYTGSGFYDARFGEHFADLSSLVTTEIKLPQQEVSRYSIEEITKAFITLDWMQSSLETLKAELVGNKDPEYIEYLRLKTKFES